MGMWEDWDLNARGDADDWDDEPFGPAGPFNDGTEEEPWDELVPMVDMVSNYVEMLLADEGFHVVDKTWRDIFAGETCKHCKNFHYYGDWGKNTEWCPRFDSDQIPF